MNILLTGSQGFIGSYICDLLLKSGYNVVGIDNYSKYGRVIRPHDKHEKFELIEHDLIKKIPEIGTFDYIIAGAAMIGGISYFNKYAYDLFVTNERIIANTFDYALNHRPKKIIVISSSMVFESEDRFPSKEEYVNDCKIPLSSYGYQKLATEICAKAAYKQYGLIYNIVRPFNCVGVGEQESKSTDKLLIGNKEMLMSHVVPDIIYRTLNSTRNSPLYILGSGEQVRHYTNGKDIAIGLKMVMESNFNNEDFNISTKVSTTVNELADFIWTEIHGCNPIIINVDPLEYDVQIRSPDVNKAKQMLGFEANIHWKDSVREVIDWMT